MDRDWPTIIAEDFGGNGWEALMFYVTEDFEDTLIDFDWAYKDRS